MESEMSHNNLDGFIISLCIQSDCLCADSQMEYGNVWPKNTIQEIRWPTKKTKIYPRYSENSASLALSKIRPNWWFVVTISTDYWAIYHKLFSTGRSKLSLYFWFWNEILNFWWECTLFWKSRVLLYLSSLLNFNENANPNMTESRSQSSLLSINAS